VITLSSTGKLQAKLAGAVSSSEVQIVAAVVDVNANAVTPAAATSQSNGASLVDIVAAPASGSTRKVQLLNFHNQDTAAVELTVQYLDNATARRLWQGELAAGDTLQYLDGRGFFLPVACT